jgi:glycosyltransferase involved in cell wall biosynthesis
VRARLAGGRPLIGHFGTFGRLIRPLLVDAIPAVIREAHATLLLIGRGSDVMAGELGRRWPDLQPHIAGVGGLDARGVSHHVAACDVMLQPYPDGVSTRRTSVMVALAHGRPVVTTRGPLTEQLWGQTPGIVGCPVGDTAALVQACVALAAPNPARAWHSAAARALYASQFDLRHTITMLRGPDVAAARKAS